LIHICVPTLVINAKNDPFLPASALPRASEVSSAVVLEQPEEGGHVGFVGGAFPGNSSWLPAVILRFFGNARGHQREPRDNAGFQSHQ
jgi:predicted alpha/beta-fold hydrolase